MKSKKKNPRGAWDQETKAYFDDTAARYDESWDGRFAKSMYGAVIRETQKGRPRRVLDLGCGNGNVLAALRAGGTEELFGLDLSEQMVRQAQLRLKEGARIRTGDAASLPYEDGFFDAVVCCASFHHYTQADKALEEMRRVLRPSGRLILGDPTAPALFLPLLNLFVRARGSGDYHIYGRRELESLLKGHGFAPESWEKVGEHAFVLAARRSI